MLNITNEVNQDTDYEVIKINPIIHVIGELTNSFSSESEYIFELKDGRKIRVISEVKIVVSKVEKLPELC